jgi:carbonic anhydrase
MSGSKRYAGRVLPPAAPAALGRRSLLAALGAGLVAAPLAACGHQQDAAGSEDTEQALDRDDSAVLTWRQARARMEEGNTRFVEGMPEHPDASEERRKALAEGKQRPFAAVLSCADSRVPPEVIFDQGFGDLFVVRSAGQVLDDAVLGSLQYAVAELAPPLLVVLGHSSCGAVKATAEALEKGGRTGTAIDALVQAIAPAVREAEESGTQKDALIDVAVEYNVERIVGELGAARLLGPTAKQRKLKIIGAVYELDTGEVAFQ